MNATSQKFKHTFSNDAYFFIFISFYFVDSNCGFQIYEQDMWNSKASKKKILNKTKYLSRVIILRM